MNSLLAQQHPSHKLQRGECRDFRHAMTQVVAQWALERRGDEPDIAALLGEYKTAAMQCLAEYDKRVRPVERKLFATWAASADENVKTIGEAALSGEWGHWPCERGCFRRRPQPNPPSVAAGERVPARAQVMVDALCISAAAQDALATCLDRDRPL